MYLFVKERLALFYFVFVFFILFLFKFIQDFMHVVKSSKKSKSFQKQNTQILFFLQMPENKVSLFV